MHTHRVDERNGVSLHVNPWRQVHKKTLSSRTTHTWACNPCRCTTSLVDESSLPFALPLCFSITTVSCRIFHSLNPRTRLLILYTPNPPPTTPNKLAIACVVVKVATSTALLLTPKAVTAATIPGAAKPPVTANRPPTKTPAAVICKLRLTHSFLFRERGCCCV